MTSREIIAAVAARHGLTPADLTGPSRRRYIAWPRQEAMARLQVQLGWSTPRIGRALGDRHHTTVMHGIRAYTARLQEIVRRGER